MQLIRNLFMLFLFYLILALPLAYILLLIYPSSVSGGVVGVVSAFIVGYIYSSRTKEAMNTILKFKVTMAVLIFNVLYISYKVFASDQDLDAIVIITAFIFPIVQALIVYPFLSLGSKTYLKYSQPKTV